MRITKKLLLAVLSAVLVLTLPALIGCDNSEGSKGLAFNDKLQNSYVVDTLIDLTDAIDCPEGEKVKLKATCEKDGEEISYTTIALTFRPTELGETTLTVICGENSISTKILVIETKPSIIATNELQYEKGTTVLLSEIEKNVSVLPVGLKAQIDSVKIVGGEETDLNGRTSFTFNRIAEYDFHFTVSNSSGTVEGNIAVNVVREMTDKEQNDLTNNIKGMDYAVVEQVDERSTDSDWAWKVTATPTGVYADGTNRTYWLSRCYIDFGTMIDLSKQYFEMDVYATENTYEGGLLIYYAPSYPNQLQWHVTERTTYGDWTTISTAHNYIKDNPDKNGVKVCGIILSVLHRQTGEYNTEQVYMIFDNLKICDYPVIGENEINDYTNKGTSTSSSGVSFKRDTTQFAEGSDWSYRFGTKSVFKAADYPYADVIFTTNQENLSFSDYDFSFFVKGNDAYKVNEFVFTILYFSNGNLQMEGSYNRSSIEEGAWNYVSSFTKSFKSKVFAGIRFMLNTKTKDVRDACLWIDNLFVFNKSENEISDFSNRISVNKMNAVTVSQKIDDHGENSNWAWKLNGGHFEYFQISFDKTYAFSNNYFTIDVKPTENFGGKIIAQFIAGDGTVKKNWTFDNVETGVWQTLSTAADESRLLASYSGVNIYIVSDDYSARTEILIDNVKVLSKGKTAYIGVDADEWVVVQNGDATTITLTSFTDGEKYVSYVKDDGYTNEFISFKTVLNGTQNADLAVGARIPTLYRYASVYNKDGFYIRFNNGFFTLYGPTFNGKHCGSYNYSPSPAVGAEYLIKFGVISNNGYVKAYLLIYDDSGKLFSEYTWIYQNKGQTDEALIDPSSVYSGSFAVYSLSGNEKTFTVYKPERFTPAPKITVENGTASWGEPIYDSYLISVNNGAWTTNYDGSYSAPANGIYTLRVKGVIDGIESEIVTKEFLVSDENIEIGNMINASSTELTCASGDITFTSAENVNTSSRLSSVVSTLAIKGDYNSEFIKIGFTPVSSKYGDNHIAIDLRQNSVITSSNGAFWSISPWMYGSGVALTCNGHTSDVAAYGGQHKGEFILGNASILNGLNTSKTYYAIAGVVDTDDDHLIYFGLLDENEQIIVLICWSQNAIVNSGESGSSYFATMRESGYFVVKSWIGEERTLTWEIIDAPSCLSTGFTYSNMKNITETENADGTVSVAFTPADGVATGTFSNSSNAASINYIEKQGENVFVQVKFTAIDSDISKNGIAIGYRSPSFSNNVDATRRLRFGSSWAYSYSMPGDKQNYDNHTNLVSGGSTALTVGKEYMITFGMHTDYNGTPDDTSDDTRILYLFISLIENDTETLKYAKTFNWTAITNGSPTYLAEGYIQVFSWCAGERTLTVGLTDYDTVNAEYISQINQ